ncbi:MAG: hypothetical protein V1879_05570, partial [Pseudomonadota bacterium]
MQYTNVSKEEVGQAQFPHNLFISGVFIFDLLMTPAVLAMKIGMIGLLIPLVCSGALIAWIYLRSRRTTTWFVDMHWRIAFSRCKLLMLGYAISGTLIFLAWLISISMKDHNMGSIVWTALTRVGLMPTVILVLVTAVME